jgi:hypothetical protein
MHSWPGEYFGKCCIHLVHSAMAQSLGVLGLMEEVWSQCWGVHSVFLAVQTKVPDGPLGTWDGMAADMDSAP